MEIKGKYMVIFRRPQSASEVVTRYVKSFIGCCDNFTPSGICVFSNEEDEYLLVHQKDIVQMYPISK